MAQRHMKRSEVEATKDYPFRQAASGIKASYPEVENIRVEVRPSGVGFEPFQPGGERLEVYTQDNFRPIINCRNPRCYNGGLELDCLVRWAVVEAGRTEYETEMSCGGYEGSPKGRRKDGPCYTSFKVKITAAYKAEANRADQS
jgi:hypothetical protein